MYQQTEQSAHSGANIFAKYKAKTGNEEDALLKGQVISAKADAQGKHKIIDRCKYCGKEDEFFKTSAVMENHIKNLCKMTTKCQFCNGLVEAKELKDHWLNHCRKGPFA